ncbi:MAG TPA: hypothetical protein VID94_16005, partial [Acidimicrobiales bacterium]
MLRIERPCEQLTQWGRCSQPVRRAGLCLFHFNVIFDDRWQRKTAAGGRPDAYYEEKLVLGLLQPTWDYMTESEAKAVLYGRP